jgi:transcriptional regulator with XRE-family HTH domain
MEATPIDLDLLATHLKRRIQQKDLSIRAAAGEIGCSATTLARLMEGSKSSNVPDFINVMRAISWLDKRVSDFEHGGPKSPTTIADVEAHLRALRDISKADAEALVAMVRAAYDAARELRAKKSPGR